VAIWQLTDRSIARALLARAASGVSVQIISDDYNLWAKDSEFSYLFKERARLGLDNLEIISDGWRSLDLDNIYQAADGGFFNSYFHRHDLLIDDRMLTMGTANWTYRGFWQNDENALVTDDQEIIQAWLNSWNYHYQALRSKKLLLTGTATGFTLDSQQAAGWQNENLLAICEVSGAVRPPEILLQTVLTDSSTTFSIAAPCPQPINLFIYNNQNDLLASGWLE
jgi:phosphatidylserine/phosphatidylglycerophosphate/cardiolipin synthase-like enzyme